MKKISILSTLILMLGANLLAQELDKTPQITVIGNAEIFVEPDEAYISVDVTKLDKNLEIAKKQSDEAAAKIIDLTRRYKIPATDVSIRNISVEMKHKFIRDPKNPVYNEDGNLMSEKIFLGYEVSKTIRIKLKEIAKFEEFFTELLKTGLTEINSVSFETSQLRKYKDQAREMALKAAKEKATDMAAAIGQTIGKAIRITEGTVSSMIQNFSTPNIVSPGLRSSSEVVTTNVGTFSPGTIAVSAQVTVVFILN